MPFPSRRSPCLQSPTPSNLPTQRACSCPPQRVALRLSALHRWSPPLGPNCCQCFGIAEASRTTSRARVQQPLFWSVLGRRHLLPQPQHSVPPVACPRCCPLRKRRTKRPGRRDRSRRTQCHQHCCQPHGAALPSAPPQSQLPDHQPVPLPPAPPPLPPWRFPSHRVRGAPPAGAAGAVRRPAPRQPLPSAPHGPPSHAPP
mmetsp:Transcript_59110/g.98060  ORF Transcript_59110/g.98060 Transcript_59110/m.98060 type:complete len:201 (-) Transcript_59110:264-866(-)